MARRAGTSPLLDYAQVGDVLYNGFDLGGARFYPFDQNLAITPPATFSNYIGDAMSLQVAPPVSALTGTAGAATGSATNSRISNMPFSRYSPLPWVIGGLILALVAMYSVHYRK